jgi:phosphatidylglycerophosphate synthase
MNGRPETLFPLVRHLSVRVTPVLARLPVSANQITAASLLFGLGCAWCLMQGGRAMAVAGAVFLVIDYVLDNCDGEIARLKNQCSEFGMHFDSFVDWIVHAAFFAALGIGAGGDLWLWLGWIAAAGCTVNYLAGFLIKWRAAARNEVTAAELPPEDADKPANWKEWLLYAFRELARADFCFLVLVLALFDLTWVLLPAGAIGAQVYWATQFLRRAREFHV